MNEPGSSPDRRTGGCQCGAVRFAVSAAPQEISVCYCRMCQKAGGGPFMAMARFSSAVVTWTRGQPSFFASSTVATRGFCARCGTPLTYQWAPESLSLMTGTFDDPGDLEPTLRFGVEGLLPWTDHLAELPGESADDWLASAPDLESNFRTYQHPDHDT